jgi:WD40 repeat protein
VADPEDDPSQVSPRTRLWKQKRRSAQIIVDVMTCLDAQKVASIQREFIKHPDNAVDVKEFVRIMEDHLENFGQLREQMYQGVTRSEEEVDEVTRTDLLLNLRELFDEIDINGDQLMEWTEFTAFISEKAGLTNAIGLDAITEYRDIVRDPSVRRVKKRAKPFQDCYYVQPLDAVACIDGNVPVVFMYSAENGNPIAELKSADVTGMPTAMEYIGKPVVRRFDTAGRLAVACADSSIVSWTLDHKSKKYKQFGVHSAWPTPHPQMCLKWNDRHNLLFSGSVAGTVHAWDCEERDEVTCLIGHTDMVLDLCSLDTIESIASCSLDTTISIWDVLTGSRRQLLQGHRMGVTSMAYHEQRRLLISSGFDHEAMVWSPFTPTVLYKLKGHTSPLVGVNVVPNSNQVVTADTEGLCKIWDVRTFQCVQSYNMDGGGNPNGEGGFAANGGAAEENDFQFTDHQKLYAFTTCHHRPRHLSERSTDRLVGVSLRLNFFEQRPVNVDTGGADDLPVRCSLYNNVLCSVLTAHGDSIKIWSTLTGSLSRTFAHITKNGSDITAICMDNRRRKFIIGDHLGDIQVHNYQSGAFMKSFDPHLSQVSNLIYVDDVKQVVR